MSTIENPRSRFHPSYFPRFDAIVASGVNPHAAATVLGNELENERLTSNAKVAAPPKAPAPKAPTPVAPKPAAPAPKPSATDDLRNLTVEQLRVVAQTHALVAAHHRGELPVADTQSTEFSARLDAAFGSDQRTLPGVVMSAGGAIQSFGVPVPAPAPTSSKPAYATPAAPQRMPHPSGNLTAAQRSALDMAFGDGGKSADGVRVTADGVQQFGVRL